MRVRGKSNWHGLECWLTSLAGPRRSCALLPSRLRPGLFGSD